MVQIMVRLVLGRRVGVVEVVLLDGVSLGAVEDALLDGLALGSEVRIDDSGMQEGLSLRRRVVRAVESAHSTGKNCRGHAYSTAHAYITQV